MPQEYTANTIVVLRAHAEQKDALAVFLEKGGPRPCLICYLVSAEAPYYLHVKIPPDWGDLLIPHEAVCFVGFGARRVLRGFAPDAS